MADARKSTDGPTTASSDAFDYTKLPDFDNDFVDEAGIEAFANALAAPEPSPSQDDLSSPGGQLRPNLYITALNDWKPIRQKVRKRKKAPPRRGVDETREGWVYGLAKWPMFISVVGWIVSLFIAYLFTRVYIYLYEHIFTWRGQRERLRRSMNSKTSYKDWKEAAQELDHHLGNDKWKETDEYAYYDSKALRRLVKNLRTLRSQAEKEEDDNDLDSSPAVEDLCGLLEVCIKNNFVGFENPRLYSETYYGTKDLVQTYVDEAETALAFIFKTRYLDNDRKRALFKQFQTNLGRTALCLSGGASFAYYHFGVVKALLDADLLPEVITGTSGGALVASLLATRTNDELKRLLVPALAHRITACEDAFTTWIPRWWRTGARFDSLAWARKCSWFCRGNMTFREAYQRTGRILNVSCVPSDPHSPTILANYLTSPDCVIWSAVMASAAVPGILNPVVLMKKRKDGRLEPYSLGAKWKDGSLRTDIPLKALNLHFNVNFSIVSQVNPHVNFFFFSSRGTVGRPVTHRRGRGWRGGFLGSAIEQYLKLDLTKWLKVLKHLELLPRWMNQDWTMLWLQRFNGTITLWPKAIPSDFIHILSDPNPKRLARMIHVGQLSAWPRLKFIGNRMKIEKQIEKGRRTFRLTTRVNGDHGFNNILSDEDLRARMKRLQSDNNIVAPKPFSASEGSDSDSDNAEFEMRRNASIGRGLELPPPFDPANAEDQLDNQLTHSPTLSARFSNWWNRSQATLDRQKGGRPVSMFEMRPKDYKKFYEQLAANQLSHRRNSTFEELDRQSQVFFDDTDGDRETGASESDGEGFDSVMPTTFTYTDENPFEEPLSYADEDNEPTEQRLPRGRDFQNSMNASISTKHSQRTERRNSSRPARRSGRRKNGLGHILSGLFRSKSRPNN